MTLEPAGPHPEFADPDRLEPRCEFALCRREAELEVTLGEDLDPILVCGLHVTPVVTWGQPEPDEPPTIRYLSCRPESAA